MENLSKKVGFLKGLLEGGALREEEGSDKLLSGIVELLGDITDRLEAMDELLDDLNDYVESIDDDLSELESERDDFFDDDDEDEDFDFDGEDQLHLLTADDDDEDDEDEDDDEDDDEPDVEGFLVGSICPECHRTFFVDLEDGDGAEYLCPYCSKRVPRDLLTPENTRIAKPIVDEE